MKLKNVYFHKNLGDGPPLVPTTLFLEITDTMYTAGFSLYLQNKKRGLL